ncbi:MAG TPA: molybdate ABC transporter substrate-binding protein [Xanthobacteraceae bacterium]|jgi:molybdate transport system substrate-binding protein
MRKCVRVAKLTAVRLLILGAAAVTILLGSFGSQVQAQFRDVVVFGAASLREALADANNLFLSENGSGVVVTYGASLALAKRIETGAAADVFIPADSDSMDYLAERKLIMPDTRDNLLRNKLVLVARAASNVTLTIGQNFPLAQALGNGRLAMADPVLASAGKYGKTALESLGVWQSVADKIVPAPDVRAALGLVSRGEATLGIVYETDAAADKNVKIVAAFPEESHPPIIYPIAILAKSMNGVASVYVQYLLSPKATRFFEKRGFVAY